MVAPLPAPVSVVGKQRREAGPFLVGKPRDAPPEGGRRSFRGRRCSYSVDGRPVGPARPVTAFGYRLVDLASQ